MNNYLNSKTLSIQNLEAKKINDWNDKQSRIEEATRKKDELNVDFKNRAKEALDAKFEQQEEKREAIMSDIKEKLKVIFIKRRIQTSKKIDLVNRYKNLN